MNENLNLVKILDGCPVGTKFYNTVYGECTFLCVSDHRYYPVKLQAYSEFNNSYSTVMLTKDGRTMYSHSGECVLFPSKDQRDWSKFERFWDRKFDLNTLEPFDKVLVRNRKTEIWLNDMFTFHIDESVAKCITGAYMQCIPYNEDTKHLLGTTNDCPVYYKWWEE